MTIVIHCREKPGRSFVGLSAALALWYASSTNPGERDFRARFVEVNQDIMSVSDQVGQEGLFSGLLNTSLSTFVFGIQAGLPNSSLSMFYPTRSGTRPPSRTSCRCRGG